MTSRTLEVSRSVMDATLPYALPIGLSAFLLFSVEPLVGRLVLRRERDAREQRVRCHKQRAEPGGVSADHSGGSLCAVVRSGNGTDGLLDHLVTDPAGTLTRARANLAQLRRVHPTGMSARWLDAWESVLDDGPEAVLQTLSSQAPLAIELRQNSPFAGVISETERAAVLHAFRAQERGVHA